MFSGVETPVYTPPPFQDETCREAATEYRRGFQPLEWIQAFLRSQRLCGVCSFHS